MLQKQHQGEHQRLNFRPTTTQKCLLLAKQPEEAKVGGIVKSKRLVSWTIVLSRCLEKSTELTMSSGEHPNNSKQTELLPPQTHPKVEPHISVSPEYVGKEELCTATFLAKGKYRPGMQLRTTNLWGKV